MFFLNTTLVNWQQENQRSLRIALIAALLLLSACSNVPQVQPIEIVVPEIKQPPAHHNLPNPKPIKTRSIKWIVLTPGTLPTAKDWVLFCISPEDYQDLSFNQADTLRWIKEAFWRLEFYTDQNTED